MQKICKNCKFYTDSEKLKEEIHKKFSYGFLNEIPNNGNCEILSPTAFNDQEGDDKICISWNDDFELNLFVKPNFGCIHFKEK